MIIKKTITTIGRKSKGQSWHKLTSKHTHKKGTLCSEYTNVANIAAELPERASVHFFEWWSRKKK